MTVKVTQSSSATIELIHFDDDAAGTLANQVAPLQEKYSQRFTLTPVCTDPEDWPGFVRAVTQSPADLVIPTLHGQHGDETLGTTDHGPWRRITEVFNAGSTSAPVLLLFSCCQNQWMKTWRKVAPQSTLVLSSSKDTDTIDRIVQGLLTGDRATLRPPAALAALPSPVEQHWHVHVPETEPLRS